MKRNISCSRSCFSLGSMSLFCLSHDHTRVAASGSGGLNPLSASLQFHIVLISTRLCACLFLCECAAFIGMCPLTAAIKYKALF